MSICTDTHEITWPLRGVALGNLRDRYFLRWACGECIWPPDIVEAIWRAPEPSLDELPAFVRARAIA